MALSSTTEKARVQYGQGAMPSSLDADLYTSTTVYKGSLVCRDTSHGYCVKGTASTTLIPLGVSIEQVVNSGSSGAKKAKVMPGIFLFSNSSSSDLIAVADRGADCYIVDDDTVAKTDGGGTRSRAGKIIDVDAEGVWVCVGPYPMANANHTHAASGATGGVVKSPLVAGTTLSFGTAGTTITVTATCAREHFKIPALNAASYVVLDRTGPAAGWEVTFTADGAQGAYAVQYFDGTTGTAISTSTTASKRHLAKFVFDGTNWAGMQFSSP